MDAHALVTAIEEQADPATFAAMSVPAHYEAAVLRRADARMFDGLSSAEKDPRTSIHIDEVPLPELAPGEALIAVMASSINYNTVWPSIFEPVSTFGFLDRYARNFF